MTKEKANEKQTKENTKESAGIMSEGSLPRELQLIIDDIVKQNGHLLEWEVFGNTTEDMRAVLTWRRIDFEEEERKRKEEEERLRKEEEERKRKEEEERRKAEEEERKRKEEEERKRRQEEERIKQEEERKKLEEERKRLEEERKRLEEEERKRKEEEERRRKEEEERRRAEEERRRLEEEERIRAEIERLRLEEEARLKAIEDERKRLEEIERKRLEEEERKRREMEEVDLNARIPRTREQVKGMLQRQRSVLNITVGEAELDDDEVDKRFPHGIQDSIFGHDWDPQCMTAEYSKQHNVGDADAEAAYWNPEDESNKRKGAKDGADGEEIGPDGSRRYATDGAEDYMVEGYDRDRKSPYYPEIYKGFEGKGPDPSDPRTRWYWYPGYFPGMYLGSGASNMYDGKGFSFNPKTMAHGYEIEYHGQNYHSKRVKKRKMRGMKMNDRRYSRPVFRKIGPYTGSKARESCVDCKLNDFCDDPRHKDEYWHMLYHDSLSPQPDTFDDCECSVCTGSAVHNGCFFRELLRLKTQFRTFDKHNYCYCSVCIPFKYRRMCLRQEFKLFRRDRQDHYYRLTDNTGDDGVVRFEIEWGSEDSDAEDVPGYGFMQAIALTEIKLKLTKDDKLSYRDCPDCQCNGFCDNIRHKKIYMMLLRIDDIDFNELQDNCWCLVCEFKGAAHSGCAEREIRRLKYDLRIFDVRNLCYCNQCVPFKYRKKCLRQELKEKRRRRGIDMYHHLYN